MILGTILGAKIKEHANKNQCEIGLSFGGSWDAPGGVRGAPAWEEPDEPGVWGRVGLGYLLNL